MRIHLTILAAATFTLTAQAFAQQPQPVRRGPGVTYAPGQDSSGQGSGKGSGFVDLSQDSSSGAGFYPLPPQYRGSTPSANRKRPVEYRNDRSAIGTAMDSEAIEYDFDPGYVFGNSHGVFNPVDGAGTPFFGGYYD